MVLLEVTATDLEQDTPSSLGDERGSPAMMQRRWVRVLAVLWMVPLVVFSNAQTASAATSGILTFHLETGSLSNAVGLGKADCRVGYAQSPTGVVVSAKSRCDSVDPDTSPGFCQPFEGSCGSYGFVLKDQHGSTCGSTGLDPISPADGDGFTHVGSQLTGGFAAVDVTDCMPVEACLSYYFDPGLGGTTDVVDCVPISLDLPDNTALTCEYGAVDYPAITQVQTIPWEPPAGWITDKGGSDGKVRVSTTQPLGGYWTLYTVFQRLDDPVNADPQMGTVLFTHHPDSGRISVAAQSLEGVPNQQILLSAWAQGGNRSGPGSPKHQVIGVGYFYAANAAAVPGLKAAKVSNGAYGVTDPSKCYVYWGKKIALPDANKPGLEDPAGPLVIGEQPEDPEAPDPEPPAPDPVPDDEPTFWGAILAILRLIARTIAGLASTLVGLMTSMLKTLFIPKPSSWGVGPLRNQLESKPPFSVAAELGDSAQDFGASYQSAGGCGVLATFGPNMTLDCGTAQGVSGYAGLYQLVSAGLIALTAQGMFKMIHNTFQDGQ